MAKASAEVIDHATALAVMAERRKGLKEALDANIRMLHRAQKENKELKERVEFFELALAEADKRLKEYENTMLQTLKKK